MINPSKLSLKKKIIISIIIFVIIVGVTIGVLFLVKSIYYNNKVNEVKNTLDKVPAVMQQGKSKYGAYPTDITNITELSNEDVRISGGGSFDGVSYCVVGISTSDKTIVYHLSSDSDEIVAGDCSSGSVMTQLSVPGDVAVAFVNKTDLKITWESTSGANGYTLECAKDNDFQNATTIKTVKTEGVCENLTADTNYYYRVSASNSSSVSDWSIVQKITTSP